MRARFLLICAFVLLPRELVHAQITWSGIFDFGVMKGGGGSKPELNQLANDYVQLNVQDIQLFVDAAVSNDVSLSAKVATARQNPFDPRSVNLELAYATFWHLAGNGLNISAGKILTPFGAFTRRQLSPDNPLIGEPLFFYYQTNVSPVTGYLDPGGVLVAQGYGGRLSTVYNGGYFTGVSAFGSFLDDALEYNVAVLNSPLSSPNTSVNMDKEVAFHGRIAVRPAIWGTVGFSYCTGSFIDHNSWNDFYSLPGWGGTEQFKQTAAGIDVRLSYLYYEINAEFISNQFRSPYIIYDSRYSPPWWSGLTGTNSSINLSSNEILIDARIDVPFFPGLFLAGRYNTVTFGNIVDPWQSSPTYGKSIPWDRTVAKYAVGLGYRPTRGVLIKVGYEKTAVDVKPTPDLDVLASQLSVSF